MKRIYILFSILCVVFVCRANDSIRVSLLTAAPGEMAYELFGHTGIRVKLSTDESGKPSYDVVYHYGVFDFGAPHFLYRFVKGETDYSIGVAPYNVFINSYIWRGSSVCEQPLNLSSSEARRLHEALRVNMLPQNRIYRYNFFYDNCATRPRDKIEDAVSGVIEYLPVDTADVTFRALLRHYTRNYPWLTFGIELALGAPLDCPITYREQMFLPEVLQQAVGNARVEEKDGSMRALSGEPTTYSGGMRPIVTPTFFTPVVVFSILLIIIVLISLYEYRCKRHFRIVDILLLALYGLAGSILFFLIFVSMHPATSPNYLALWCHPFLWIIMVAVAFSPRKRFTTQLMSVLMLTTIVALVAMAFVPQTIQYAFYLLAAIPGVRALTWVEIENDRLLR